LQRKLETILFARVAKSAVAGFLAAAVLLFGTASASHWFHHFFHSDNAANHPCVICHFAKGHVDAADIAPAVTIFVFAFLGLALLAKFPALSAIDLRLSPGRAPPVSSFS
jgi:hypothetical protein